MSEYDDEEIYARRRILKIMLELKVEQRAKLERWINSAEYSNDIKAMNEIEEQNGRLAEVSDALREELGVYGEVGTESVRHARVGDLADCTPQHTLHVDEFLCDDQLLEQLVSDGTICRYYCSRCHSRDLKELTLISHSAARRHLRYIFKYLLPARLHGQQLLDVGSRLGAVLYGAYYLTDISTIVGVEMNKELCEVQERCIDRFKMSRERIRVEHSDLMRQGDLLRTSDVVVFNVVDMFVEESKQVEMWRLLKATMHRGALLVTTRSVADTLFALGAFAEFENWLDVERPHQMHNELYVTTEDDDFTDVHLYRVK